MVDTPPAEGLTLRAYAEAKHLPAWWLSSVCGLVQRRWQVRPAVWMPVWDEQRRRLGTHIRIALGGTDRFRWAAGSRVAPYGLWRLQHARELGSCTLVEGESDCHTLWYHDEAALGVPGATCWRDEWAAALEGIPTLYVVAEPDQGGQAFLARLNRSPLRRRLSVLRLPGGAKDPSDLYLLDPPAFRQRWQDVKARAVPLTSLLPPPEEDERRDRLGSPGILPAQAGRRRRESGESIYAAVKARIRIEDYLVALGCHLRGRPPRLMTRCPIHDDHEPSCSVNTQLQLWYCHGCGRGGDVWTLDQLVHGPLHAWLSARRASRG